jgi:AbrB family looped-hinge helix DNA binding protein
MYKAKVTSKGQITIPAAVREELGLKPGERVVFLPGNDGEFRVKRAGSIKDMYGILKKLGYGPDEKPMTNEEMDEAIGEYVAALDDATRSDAAGTKDEEAA